MMFDAVNCGEKPNGFVCVHVDFTHVSTADSIHNFGQLNDYGMDDKKQSSMRRGCIKPR